MGDMERVDISERLGVTDAVRVSSRQDGPPRFPLTRERCVEPQPQTSSGMLFSVMYSKNGAHRWLQLQRSTPTNGLSCGPSSAATPYIMVRQSCLLSKTFLTYNATHCHLL